MTTEPQRIGTGQIYARLIPVKDGTLVIIADARRPRGQRMIESEVLPYPLAAVARNLAKLLNQG